jgi:hypothetical protein
VDVLVVVGTSCVLHSSQLSILGMSPRHAFRQIRCVVNHKRDICLQLELLGFCQCAMQF